MSAGPVIDRLARAGIALFLHDNGTVGFRSDRPVSAALLSAAREAKDTIAAALPALLAEPGTPCGTCRSRMFWRYSRMDGPAGAWLCNTCTPPAPNLWIDSTAFPAPVAPDSAAPPSDPLAAAKASIRTAILGALDRPPGAPAIAPISAPSTPDDRGFAAVATEGGAAATPQRQEPAHA